MSLLRGLAVPRHGLHKILRDALAHAVHFAEIVLGDSITLLSRQRAELELTFAGGLPQLAAALAQVGLALTPPLQTGFSRFAARPTGPQGLPIIRLAASR